jgi:hypothetical protein
MLKEVEVIMVCASGNDVAQVALCEFEGSDQSPGPLNLFCPACGGRPPCLIGMRDDSHAPIGKVRERILANGCARAQQRDWKNILVLRCDKLAAAR